MTGYIKCSIYNCRYSLFLCKENVDNVYFFSLPEDEERRLKWITNCFPDATSQTEFPTELRICQKHFENNMFVNINKKNRLTNLAIPTLFNDCGYQQCLADDDLEDMLLDMNLSMTNLPRPVLTLEDTLKKLDQKIELAVLLKKRSSNMISNDYIWDMVIQYNILGLRDKYGLKNNLDDPYGTTFEFLNLKMSLRFLSTIIKKYMRSEYHDYLVQKRERLIAITSMQSTSISVEDNDNSIQPCFGLPSNQTPQNGNQPISQATHSLLLSKNIEFKHTPFFKEIKTLMKPMFLTSTNSVPVFSNVYYLSASDLESINNSWDSLKEEYKVQVILRFVQVYNVEKSYKEVLPLNTIDRLPHNLSVFINNELCSFPIMLNVVPEGSFKTPSNCNVPLDITKQTIIGHSEKKTLKLQWLNETYDYVCAIYLAEKLTVEELVVELKNKPLLTSKKTEKMIKTHTKNNSDLNMDYMSITLMDPLSGLRMSIPAKGLHCIHIQCFDAIQYLHMNEKKATWLCPICKKRLQFDEIVVDEFVLKILQTTHVVDKCENVVIYPDATWAEQKSDDGQLAKRLKPNLAGINKTETKSECIPQTDNLKSNNLEITVLSVHPNSSLPSTSSEDRPIIENDCVNYTHQNESPNVIKLYEILHTRSNN